MDNSSNAIEVRAETSSTPAPLSHWFDALWRTTVHATTLQERSARAAGYGCAAIALTGFALFGIAEVPTPLRMGAPLIGISLALPLVLTLWLSVLSPRGGRLLSEVAALALVAVGSACFSRDTAVRVTLAYFLPAMLLLLAGDHLRE
jgi:hypothetical protein